MLNEMHRQFSAGIQVHEFPSFVSIGKKLLVSHYLLTDFQTVAVIPVSSHGVLQLGSSFSVSLPL